MEEPHKHRTSLFRKIFSRLLFAGILPLFGIALIGVTLLFVSYRQSAAEFEQTLLAQKRAEVERFVRETLESFEVITNIEVEGPPAYRDQEFIVRGLLNDSLELVEVSFVKTFAPADLGSTRERGQNESEEEYQREVEAVEAPVGEETFRIIRDQILPAPLRYRAEDGTFLVARMGRSVIGGVVWREGTPIVTLASPVRNKNGKVIAVIMAELRLTKLQRFFQAAGFGSSGSVFLLDEAGTVLAHSGGARFINQDASAIHIGVEDAGAKIISEGLSSGRLLASALSLAGTKWTLVAEWPLADAFAPVITLMLQILFVGALLAGALVVFARIFARGIVQPIRVVEEGVARIGRGDFSKSIELSTGDELEDLGAALNEMTGELMSLQEIRTSQIRARALAQAVEKEEKLEEAKDVLLTTASHQFRTPVSVLNWNIGLLAKMDLPKDAQELLEGVSEHSKNLAGIAADLLNATAFGADYIAEVDARPVELPKVLEEAIGRFRADADAKGLKLTLDVAAEETSLEGSYGALRIMVENLIANAVLYTPQGGSVDITVRDNVPEGTFTLSVRDTGVGIPKDEQQHVFSAFFRATNAIAVKNVGTGLGLYIVRNIVVGHGGRIHVSSEKDKGTEVVVTLLKKMPSRNAETENPEQEVSPKVS